MDATQSTPPTINHSTCGLTFFLRYDVFEFIRLKKKDHIKFNGWTRMFFSFTFIYADSANCPWENKAGKPPRWNPSTSLVPVHRLFLIPFWTSLKIPVSWGKWIRIQKQSSHVFGQVRFDLNEGVNG